MAVVAFTSAKGAPGVTVAALWGGLGAAVGILLANQVGALVVLLVYLQIGELVLLPAVRAAAAGTIIAAPGTSCRHQIADLAGREALHSVRVLDRALA